MIQISWFYLELFWNEIEHYAETFDDLKFLEELIVINEIILYLVPPINGNRQCRSLNSDR